MYPEGGCLLSGVVHLEVTHRKTCYDSESPHFSLLKHIVGQGHLKPKVIQYWSTEDSKWVTLLLNLD